MALAGGDKWLSTHESCEIQARELINKLAARNSHQRNSTDYSILNVQIRQGLKAFSNDLIKLKESLHSSSSHITERELQRRQNLIDNLGNKRKQIEEQFSSATAVTKNRNELLGNNFSAVMPGTAWDAEDTDDTRGIAVEELKQRQEQVLQAQDKGLDSLAKIIANQKQMARDIGDELDVQNELIDDIGDHVDTTRERLLRETKHVTIVDRKSGTCTYWIVILLLLVAIIVVIAVPRP